MKIHPPETFVVGDTWEIMGILAYADGSPFNLGAGCDLLWAIEDEAGSVVLELSLASGIVVLDPLGKCLITVSPAQSQGVGVGSYTDQLRATDPSGYVSTQWSGVINADASLFSP